MFNTMEENQVVAPSEQEGSLASVIPEHKEESQTVPLSVFLEEKRKRKEAEKLAKDASQSTSQEKHTSVDISQLSTKYPDVDPDFMADLVGIAKQQATKEVEEKYTPYIQKIRDEDFNKAFDPIYESELAKAKAQGVNLPKKIDKEMIKQIALQPKFRSTPLSELMKNLYGADDTGRATTENDIRPATEIVKDVIDLNKITPEQKNRIMQDPKARADFFARLDKLG